MDDRPNAFHPYLFGLLLQAPGRFELAGFLVLAVLERNTHFGQLVTQLVGLAKSLLLRASRRSSTMA